MTPHPPFGTFPKIHPFWRSWPSLSRGFKDIKYNIPMCPIKKTQIQVRWVPWLAEFRTVASWFLLTLFHLSEVMVERDGMLESGETQSDL